MIQSLLGHIIKKGESFNWGMSQLPKDFRDSQHYILENQAPVICNDESAWREFMRHGENLLVAKDSVGKYTVVTVFLGFNQGDK